MELRVESCDGHSMPNGCYVGVRVGEILKQGRYEPQRCYFFPQGGRSAKIDIYQHVGSCIVAIDQDVKSSHEVSVTSTEPTFPATKINVSVQPKGHDTDKKERQERAKMLKDQAKDYLAKYRIEERLSEAVKALLKEQPTDPTKFLCKYLSASADQTAVPPAAQQKAEKKSQAPPAKSKESEQMKAAQKPENQATAPPPKAKEEPEAKQAPAPEPAPAPPKEDQSQPQSQPPPVVPSEPVKAPPAAAVVYPLPDTSMWARFDSAPAVPVSTVNLVPDFASFGMQPSLLFI
eukprot:gb/GFBE01076337.1/.p1 GENE.gb/GFBE01076337.1/~~gb/GFBE01076337.1/.p1  ORF type:complete len:290 (+),score=82.97 gb/GFBE01076337.1/:1-870(+)